jgi:hypothetical protein
MFASSSGVDLSPAAVRKALMSPFNLVIWVAVCQRLTQLPQLIAENNFFRVTIGNGVEPVGAEHAKVNVV